MTEVSFGEWLKRRRGAEGWTQRQLAQKINCSTSALRKMESEERRPSAQIVEQLAEVFKIPHNERKTFLRFARGDWSQAPSERDGETPWLSSKKASRMNLPASLTSLIGREGQLAEIHDYLLRAEIRLVTLIGPPGIGKTRLGTEAAGRSLSDFLDGVFFVQLAQFEDPSLIASTTRQALGYMENQKLSADQQLREGIGKKQMLIVLDNCEHLIGAVATFASELLSACPHLKILATSREALRVPGEWLYVVPVLGVPKKDLLVNINDVVQFPALTLFTERARAVRSDFILTPDNIPTVIDICRYLDGLPLAIELIAAQMRFLSPQALLERLNEKFVLSAEGMRTAPSRQISLNHAFNWSYDSLTPDEQKLFAGLSVFSGGFTLEAAEAIFSGTVMKKSVSDLVASLLDKSLLQRSLPVGDELRFNMLVTIRHFAGEHLRNLGEAEEVSDRHLTYFLDIAEQADLEIRGPQQLLWFDRLESEHDNLRAALRWALESNQVDSGLRLAGALAFFWFVRGYTSEGIGWLERVLAQGKDSSTAAVARVLNYLGGMLRSGKSANPVRIMNMVERSLHLYQELDDKAGIAWVLNNLGLIAHEQKDYRRAKQFFKESLALRRAVGDPWFIAHTLQNLPSIALEEKDYAGAKQLAEETIKLFRQAGDQRGAARTLADLAQFERVTGNPAHAVALLKQALPPLMNLKDRWSIASVLEELATLAKTQDDFQRAVRLHSAAEALLETIGLWLPPDVRAQFENNMRMIQKNLEDPIFTKAWEEGHAMTLEQAVAYALE